MSRIRPDPRAVSRAGAPGNLTEILSPLGSDRPNVGPLVDRSVLSLLPFAEPGVAGPTRRRARATAGPEDDGARRRLAPETARATGRLRSPEMRAILAPAVLRRPAFRRLCIANALSPIGAGVAGVAVPLTAVLTLGASPIEMGLIQAAATTPALLLSLPVGVWVDRWARRPILLACEFGRAALLTLIPLTAIGGILTIPSLIAIVLLVGILTVIFDIAQTSYVPSLVARDELVEANSTLLAMASSHRIVVPTVSGWLVSLIGPPLAVVLDALAHLGSGFAIGGIRDAEPAVRRSAGRMRDEIAEGWRAFWDDRTLRRLILATTAGAFGGGVRGAIILLYAVGALGIGPVALGAILGAYGVAALGGAFAAQAAGRRWSVGAVLVGSNVLLLVGSGIVPAASAVPEMGGAILLAAHAVLGVGMTVYSINQISLRQAIVPSHLLGRVNATRRVLVFGIQPIAAIVGGALGEAIGLVPTLLVGLAVELIGLAIAWPLRRLRA